MSADDSGPSNQLSSLSSPEENCNNNNNKKNHFTDISNKKALRKERLQKLIKNISAIESSKDSKNNKNPSPASPALTDLSLSSSESLTDVEKKFSKITGIQSIGLFVWSQKFSELSGWKMVDNFVCIFEPEKLPPSPDTEEFTKTDFCDFTFPILVGQPDILPIDEVWLKKLDTHILPGCHLLCAQHKLPSVLTLEERQKIDVHIHSTDQFTTAERLNGNLYFLMRAALRTDVNLNVAEYIDLVDDIDSVMGHFFAHRASPNMYVLLNQLKTSTIRPRSKTRFQKMYEEWIKDPAIENIGQSKHFRSLGDKQVRSLARHVDIEQMFQKYSIPDLDRLRAINFLDIPKTDKNYYSERTLFFLSQDSHVVLLDQNCSFDPIQGKIMRDIEEKHKPFMRLIRSHSFVVIEGTPRYCDLSHPHQTFQTRAALLGRLTSFPMIITPEGIKCFDAYYNNDGLDFTYFDKIPLQQLMIVDWYQLQLDFKMDQQPRFFKGHILWWRELCDIASNLVFSALKFDPILAARINVLCMEEEDPSRGITTDETDPEKRPRPMPLLLVNLQQVCYTYFSPLKSTMEVMWNVFFRLDEDHIHLTHEKSELAINPLYFYMKSFNCVYTWWQKDADTMIKEDSICNVSLSEFDVTDIDLSRIGWSRQMFDQYLTIYLGRLYPYQDSLKAWLLRETRLIKRHLIVRPTPLTEKLQFRNLSVEKRVEQFLKDQAAKPRKHFLNFKHLPKEKDNKDDRDGKKPKSNEKNSKSNSASKMENSKSQIQ